MYFSEEKLRYFLLFLGSKHKLWVLVRMASNEYHNLCLRAKLKNIKWSEHHDNKSE